MRRGPLGQALREGRATVFPADMLDQAERQLRSCLEHRSVECIVSALKRALQISKLAAAQRQLDAAIRMFFQREDELAIHTLTAAAFQILRDLAKKRGAHFTKEVFKSGIIEIAQQHVAGTLPADKKTMIEGSSLMPVIEGLADDIRVQGGKFDKERIRISEGHEFFAIVAPSSGCGTAMIFRLARTLWFEYSISRRKSIEMENTGFSTY